MEVTAVEREFERRKTRTIDPSVTEHGDEGMHRRLATSGSVRGLVLEFLLKMILEPPTGIEGAGFRVGDGHIYVNGTFVDRHWLRVMTDNRRAPTLTRIGLTLSGISLGEPTKITFGGA